MPFQQTTDNPVKHRFDDFGKNRIEVAKWRIRLRDAFNLSYLYTFLHDWVVEEGWAPLDDHNFPETYYVNRDDPKRGKEIWIRWRLSKYPEGMGGSLLWKYVLDINWKLVGVKDTEVVWKGQKVKTNRGELEMDGIGMIIIDTEKAFEKGIFKQFKKVYYDRLMRRQMGMHWKAVYNDAYRLRDMIMNYFKLETFYPEKEQGEFYLKRTLE